MKFQTEVEHNHRPFFDMFIDNISNALSPLKEIDDLEEEEENEQKKIERINTNVMLIHTLREDK